MITRKSALRKAKQYNEHWPLIAKDLSAYTLWMWRRSDRSTYSHGRIPFNHEGAWFSALRWKMHKLDEIARKYGWQE